MKPKRISIVTAGHLATCPRAVRIADALAEAGHAVRVVSTRFLDWADAADAALRRTRDWQWATIDYRRDAARVPAVESSLRWRTARRAAAACTASGTPLWIAFRAYSRMFPELAHAAAAEPADLIYGCSNGGLAPAFAAAQSRRTRYALDLEDFHSGENPPGDEGRFTDALAERVERALLPGAALLTAGSPSIAAAYARKYGVHAVPLNNTLPLPEAEPDFDAPPAGTLHLRWIGQTLGPGKGFHTVVRAIGIAGIRAEIVARGRALPDYAADLARLAAAVAPALELTLLPPLPPDELPSFCSSGDIGLAPAHTQEIYSNQVALPNKAFTYMTAGLAVALGHSEGHRELAADLGEGAVVFAREDPRALADGLRRWAGDRASLERARRASFAAARRRWNWSRDRDTLLDAVGRALA